MTRNLFKEILQLLKVDVLISKVVGYGLQRVIQKDPFLFKKLEDSYCSQYNNELRSNIGHIGHGCYLHGFLKLSHPKGLILENNVHIGAGAYINSRGGVIIKDHTHISRNVTIYSSNHDYNGPILPFGPNYIERPVIIGKGVWIGMNVNILPGVTIGDGAIIGMGATISKDVPPNAVVVGSEQRHVKSRSKENISALLTTAKFGGINGKVLPTREVQLFKKRLGENGASPFFIVSTGRSGSTTIANILNKHEGIDCLHEPKIHLVGLSTRWLHGDIPEAELLRELHILYKDLATSNQRIYGESDQKLSNLVLPLAKILPEAKFIWIIRKPEDVVNSTWSRGWFSDEELGFTDMPAENYSLYRDHFSDHRPHADKCGDMNTEQWRAMSAFERNCWYWTYWNSMIQTSFSSLAKERTLKVRLENLSSDLTKIESFLSLEKDQLREQVANKAESIYKLNTTSDWNEQMKASFNRLIDYSLYTEEIS